MKNRVFILGAVLALLAGTMNAQGPEAPGDVMNPFTELAKTFHVEPIAEEPVRATFPWKFNTADYFTVSTIVDPVGSFKENGLNFGVEIEYVGPIYASARIENFEALPGGYTSLTGAIGTQFVHGYETKWRWYVGWRGGRVWRNGAGNPITGFEAGVDFAFGRDKEWFVGLRGAFDWRGDAEAFQDDPYWRENGYIKFGYRWDWKGRKFTQR